jgi:hypothetical protein
MKESRWTYTGGKGQITIKGRSGRGGHVIVPSRIDGYPLTHIGRDTFHGDAAPAEIRLPEGLWAIEGRAFEGCPAPGSIYIPAPVKKIEGCAFSVCAGLKSFTISRGLHYTLREKHLTRTFEEDCACAAPGRLETTTHMGIALLLFAGCAGLEDLAIPEEVAAAGDGAFCGCGKLPEKQREEIAARFGKAVFNSCYAKFTKHKEFTTTVRADIDKSKGFRFKVRVLR